MLSGCLTQHRVRLLHQRRDVAATITWAPTPDPDCSCPSRPRSPPSWSRHLQQIGASDTSSTLVNPPSAHEILRQSDKQTLLFRIYWTFSLQATGCPPTSYNSKHTMSAQNWLQLPNPPSTPRVTNNGKRQPRKYQWLCRRGSLDDESHQSASGFFWSSRDHHLLFEQHGSDCLCNACGEPMTPDCKVLTSLGTPMRLLGGFSIQWERLAPAG